ncbi:MAG: enoyl-CoA hydratase/isomerase family protein [Dehalococcoidia bacterium]|nr:enoyl-CoA hydratase/isomerase family protein [Dehalococcoidia bacterium]
MTVGNQYLLYKVEDHVATITFNRPDRLNAMSGEMLEGLYEALVASQEDDDVRVLVLTGAGRGFCSGMDLGRKAEAGPPVVQEPPSLAESTRGVVSRGAGRVCVYTTQYLEKPYIAMVNGAAAGGGFDLASMADIRIVSELARGTINHVRLGLLSADGGYFPLARIVGASKAMEMVFTGKLYSAAELKEFGWANHVVPHDQLESFTYAMARDIAEGAAPVSARFAKGLIRSSLDQDILDHFHELGLAQTICRTTEDSKEGPRAFSENRRKPNFKGR